VVLLEITSIAYFSLACSLSPLVVTISLNSLLVCLTEESLYGTIFSEVPWILILGFYVNKNHCEFINNCFCNLIHYFFFLQCQITTGSTSGHLDTVPYCMYYLETQLYLSTGIHGPKPADPGPSNKILKISV